MAKLGDVDLGSAPVHALHLSQRFSSGEDGYYRCVAQIPLDVSAAEGGGLPREGGAEERKGDGGAEEGPLGQRQRRKRRY